MLDNCVFELYVSVKGVLGTVESVAVSIGTGHFLHNVLVAPPVQFFGVLGLPFFDFSDLFEHF